MWLGALLPLGVVGQAVLGGFTVKGALDYGWVMGHFALSMLILLAAVLLAWRAVRRARPGGARRATRSRAGPRAAAEQRPRCARSARSSVLGAVTIFAGTAATAAGPHAGGSPGQKINRLDFDGRGHDGLRDPPPRRDRARLRPGGGRRCGGWRARREAPQLQRPLTVLCCAARAAGRGRPGPVRDAPAHRARVGARGARLRRPGWRRCGRPAPAGAAGAATSARVGASEAVRGVRCGRPAPLEFPGN